MYQEYGESEPVGTLTIISGFVQIGLFAICLVYFVISFIISLIYGLKRKNNLSIRDKKMILLNLVGFASIVNTIILFIRSTTFPSYADFKIHFIINILSVVFIVFLLCWNLIINVKRKTKNEKKVGYILANIFSILYVVLIIAGQIYK